MQHITDRIVILGAIDTDRQIGSVHNPGGQHEKALEFSGFLYRECLPLRVTGCNNCRSDLAVGR
ncbi:hypothetical protein N8495_00675 [Akkermansiaceae bacterium]|nr:hypothetical protein [Akkermansiaceae bacterium]